MSESPTKKYPNGRCCVFQPFDKGVFDQRFDDTLSPAIEAADMEPYRVDRDTGAVIPLDTLHSEIKAAALCVADITTQNPNVMYELGYALAVGKEVVIICGPSEVPFPFDIRHRAIISYATGSLKDFRTLQEALTARLVTLAHRQEKNEEIVKVFPTQKNSGLQPHESTALALLLAASNAQGDTVPVRYLKDQMSKAGYNDIAARLAIARLVREQLIHQSVESDFNENPYFVLATTQEGEDWMLDHQADFALQHSAKDATLEDDIPF